MLDENFSYIFGLLVTDGSMYLTTRNRGKVTLEVNIKDENIVTKLYNYIPNSKVHYRTRNTNFKNNYNSVIFSNHRKEFRDFLISVGFPTAQKTDVASIPSVEYNEFAFWRGVIDGDGSIGFTGNNEPFISLVTKSESLKENYLKFLENHFNIKKKLNRNKRDGVFNIVIKNEDAVKLSELLYIVDGPSLFLDRKSEAAKTLQTWVRKKKKKKK